jgi:hypothetical protein
MRKEEAEEVIKIILQCDGGCEYCVSSLLELFIDKFPEHESIAKSVFKEKFGIALEDFLNQKHKRD